MQKQSWMQAASAGLMALSLVSGVQAQTKGKGKADAGQPLNSAQAVNAGQAAQPTSAAMLQATSVRATVQAVDMKNRTATLKREDGQVVTVKVPKSVRNFKQVKVDDVVTVEHVESMALQLLPASDAAPAAKRNQSVSVAKAGEKPSRVTVDTLDMVASVENVDYKNRTVTLRGPEGNSRTVKVDPSFSRFDQVKKGDQVRARLTEATAISVQPPEQAPSKS